MSDVAKPLILQVRNYPKLLAEAVPGRLTSSVTASGELAFVEGAVQLLPPADAWAGLQDLHRRAVGWAEPFSLLDSLTSATPEQALEAYERAVGSVLAQLSVNGPDFAGEMIDSIHEFAGGVGSLDGLDGPLISAMLRASDGPAGLDSFQMGCDIFGEFGVPLPGGGRPGTHVVDAHSVGGTMQHRLTDVTPSDIRQFVEHPDDTGLHMLRDMFHPADAGGDRSGDGGGGSAADEIFLGVFLMAVGAVTTMVVPPVGAAIEAAGGGLVAHGAAEAAHRIGSDLGLTQPGEAPSGSGSTTHSRHTTTTTERTTTTTTYPDGTVVRTHRQTTTTRKVVVDVKKKAPRDGDGSDASDDLGYGGYNPWTGQRIGVIPEATWIPEGDALASMMHYVGDDTFFLTGVPSVTDDGTMADAGIFAGSLDLEPMARVTRELALQAEARYAELLGARVKATRPVRVDAILHYNDEVLRITGSPQEKYAVAMASKGVTLLDINPDGSVVVADTVPETIDIGDIEMAAVTRLRDLGVLDPLEPLVYPMRGNDLPI